MVSYTPVGQISSSVVAVIEIARDFGSGSVLECQGERVRGGGGGDERKREYKLTTLSLLSFSPRICHLEDRFKNLFAKYFQSWQWR